MARILVIDDDPDIRPLLRIALAKFGHQTTLTARGEEGLAAAQSTPVDLILLDLMMPDIDGYEVTRRLRAEEKTKDIPIIILSARTQSADYQGALEAGADAYVPKPFDPEGLNRKIADLLKEAEARRAARPANDAAAATGRVTTVLHLRGGVGATTCAVNTAGAFARSSRRTCLMELTQSGGQVALHLRLNPFTTWADLPKQPDSTAVAQVLLKHDSGLLTLAAPSQPVRKGLAPETFLATLEALRIFFPEVVIDAAPVLDDVTVAALTHANHILLVTSPEVGAVHSAIGTLQMLAALGVEPSKTHVVLNYHASDLSLPTAAVEKALGRAPEMNLPFDRLQAPALAQGLPLVFSNPKAPLPAILGAYVASKLVPNPAG